MLSGFSFIAKSLLKTSNQKKKKKAIKSNLINYK